MQTEHPYWLDEAYSKPINMSDTGIVGRNISSIALVLATLTVLGRRDGMVVDYAGGYGLLVRMLRDKGVDAFWYDPFSENLLARGFEYRGGQAALVTAFESFEHFMYPIKEVSEMLKIAPHVLFTTSLISDPPPQPKDWWYYGLDHGQHLGFFRVRSLKFIAERFGKYLYTDGVSCHMLLDRKIPYWLWLSCKALFLRVPRLASAGLKSKTWSDYLLISRNEERG